MSIQAESDISCLLERLGTDAHSGLSRVEAHNRLRRYGTNELDRPYFRVIMAGGAAVFCIALGVLLAADRASDLAVGVTAVGACLALLALVLRARCRQAASRAGRDYPDVCSGIRAGRLLQLPVCGLVPGDIVRVQTGDAVPADGRLIEAVNLVVQERALTGSPEPVEKNALYYSDTTAQSDECKNCVFMNTVVIRGRGTFVVTQTGRDTRVGRARAHREQVGNG